MHKRSKHRDSLFIVDIDDEPEAYTIEAYEPSIRTFNALKRAGIITVFDLERIGREGLKDIRHLGETGSEEVMELMEEAKEKYLLKF